MNEAPTRQSLNARFSAFTVKLSLFYGAVFLLIGFHLPYFPVWLEWRGLSPAEIGIVLSAPLIVRVFATPVISFTADRLGDRRFVIVLLSWGTLFGYLLFTLVQGFWAVLGIAILTAVAWTSIMPVTEAVAMDGVRRDGHDYGRMRLWGSLTFIFASFGGGLALQMWGAPSALWLMIASAVCILATAYILPRPQGRGRLKEATSLPQLQVRKALAVARSPLFLLFLLATGLVQSTHAVYYAFGTINWQAQGISATVIGALWTTGVVAEILLFMVSGRAVRTFGAVNLISLAAAASVLRWAVTAFSPPLWLLFIVQVLHGLTFGAAHLGAVHFITDATPAESAGTAQGVYASFAIGIAMGGALLASGPLYAALGAAAYLAMAGGGVVALGAAVLLARLWHGENLVSTG
ncbi:MAG: MFS transporter [Hyphomicrobiaceae bacterium]|nr:MFS transporter [Hyphomicrobiaceae bacterium]